MLNLQDHHMLLQYQFKRAALWPSPPTEPEERKIKQESQGVQTQLVIVLLLCK